MSHGLLENARRAVVDAYVKAYLVLGEKTLGDCEEWAIWESALPMLKDISEAYAEAQKAIEEAGQQMSMQKNYFKQWASTLLQATRNLTASGLRPTDRLVSI